VLCVIEEHGDLINPVSLGQPSLDHLIDLEPVSTEGGNDDAVFVAPEFQNDDVKMRLPAVTSARYLVYLSRHRLTAPLLSVLQLYGDAGFFRVSQRDDAKNQVMSILNPAILTQLIPFNPHRFDACLTYLGKRLYQRPLSLFEMVKLHVMTDVFHVLKTGHQIIGGELQPWPYGPVVEPSYNRLKAWVHQHEESGGRFQPDEFRLVVSDVCTFVSTLDIDMDDLSATELEAMEQAASVLKPMSFDDAYHYFHSTDTFMGRAYIRASNENRAIAWADIIDGHDEIFGSDLQRLKQRLISYT